MHRFRAFRLPLLVVLPLAAAWAVQETGRPIPPGVRKAREARQQMEQIAAQDQARPAPVRPDWEKARADSKRLLALAQEIHDQVQAGPQQIPAPLAGKLKEVEKLAKRLRSDLLL